MFIRICIYQPKLSVGYERGGAYSRLTSMQLSVCFVIYVQPMSAMQLRDKIYVDFLSLAKDSLN